jgi:5S rRNA maturation endonuclease (ribonuclease M5)
MKLLLILFSVFSFSGFTQENDLIDPNDVLGALGNSGWESDFRQIDEVDFTYTDSQVVDNSNSEQMDRPCEKEDQNTVPYRFFLSLLASHKLDIDQDPATGKMNINGGTMIGNCNSMLESKVGRPSGDIPYTFQIAIKPSHVCDNGTCDYEVFHVDKGVNKKVTKPYSPDFQGYLSCLKDAQVVSEGKINKEKIAATDFNHSESGVYESSKLLFLSHGFKKSKLTGVYSENKIPGQGCYYFEDIQKDGFATFSKGDIKKSKLDKLFTKICSSGNYKLISQHIDDFKEVEELQELLYKIRDQLLLREVEELHSELANTEDLSTIDTKKYAEPIDDFETFVIDPLKNKLSIAQKLYAAPGSIRKEELIKELFSSEKQQRKMMDMSISEFKKEMAKYLDVKSGELVAYAQSPYLTSSDYVLMVNPKKGSPIEDSRWTKSALKLYKIQNTAFKYGRYNNDFWEANYKGKDQYQAEKRYEASVTLDSQVLANVHKKQESIELLSKTAKNPNVNYAQNYQSTKVSIMSDIDQQMMEIQKNMQEYRYKVMTNCAVEKQRKYFINQQACVRDAQAAIENCNAQLKSLAQQKSAVERKYNALTNKHSEARVQAGLATSSSAVTISSDSDYSFSFTPNQPTGNPAAYTSSMNNGQYSQPQMQIQNQGYMQSGFMPNYQNQGFYQQSPFFGQQQQQGYYDNQPEGQYGLQFGLNGGMNRGPSSYYGGGGMYNQNQFMQPQAYSGQAQGPMNYYQGQYTQPGGPMSFSF